MQSSVIGYIAKCVTLVGKGDMYAGRRACDIALELYPSYVSLFVLIKVSILCIALWIRSTHLVS